MSNFLILLFIGISSLTFGDLPLTTGCTIPQSGPQKGILPPGCDTDNKSIGGLLEESQVRCKVLDVRCDRQKKTEYIATAKVEKWLRGSGPSEISFRFSRKAKKSLKPGAFSKVGRGLCADITLEKRAMDWIATKVENPTSSSDSLPACP